MGIVPIPDAADDARSLQLVLGGALEGDHRPHSRAVAVQDLQRAELGGHDVAALCCGTKTKRRPALVL